MKNQWMLAVMGGVVGGLVVALALSAVLWVMGAQPLLAESAAGTRGPDEIASPQISATPAPAAQMTHERMHQMMDAMHGLGASDRMHEAMGPEGEMMMDQCVGMMNMMGMMQGGEGMMGGSGMQGMMGGR